MIEQKNIVALRLAADALTSTPKSWHIKFKNWVETPKNQIAIDSMRVAARAILADPPNLDHLTYVSAVQLGALIRYIAETLEGVSNEVSL